MLYNIHEIGTSSWLNEKLCTHVIFNIVFEVIFHYLYNIFYSKYTLLYYVLKPQKILLH